jgi:single-strand DNA-binding protein
MSNGLNRVMLLGNLGADPELRFTQGGQAVLNIRLATTESYLDKDKVRQERVDWHNAVVWGKRGEALAKILRKGSSVFIEGSLRTSSYDDREGNKRYKTEVIVNNIILTGGRGAEHGDSAPAEQPAPRGAPPARGGGGYGRGDYSRSISGGAPRPAPAATPEAEEYDSGYGGGDDIPF